MRGLWLCATLAGVLAGCAAVDSKPGTPWYRSVVEPMVSDNDRLARYYEQLLRKKDVELAIELETMRAVFQRDRSDLHRIQLAVLLSYPGARFRDDNAAVALLDPLVKDTGGEDSVVRPLGIWLRSQLLELRRAEEISQHQTAKLKEDLRRSEEIGARLKEELRRSDESAQQSGAKLKEEQRRSDALQLKLEAILDMEMKMIEREQNLPKKK